VVNSRPLGPPIDAGSRCRNRPGWLSTCQVATRSLLSCSGRCCPFGVVSSFVLRISCGHGQVSALSFAHELALVCSPPANDVERGEFLLLGNRPSRGCLGPHHL